jgi:hypothetical protein
MGMEQNNQTPHQSCLTRFGSYGITAAIALSFGTAVYWTTNPILGWIIGFTLFFMMSLTNVRSTLEILSEEVPQGYRIARNYLSSPQVIPLRELVDLWVLCLFRPLAFMEKRIAVYQSDGLRGFIIIWLKLSLLLLLNFMVLGIYSALAFWDAGAWVIASNLWIISSLLLAMPLINHPEVELTRPGQFNVSGFLWFILVVSWTILVFDWSIISTASILRTSFLIGLAIGCAAGVANNIHASKKLGYSVTAALGVAIFGGVLLSFLRFPFQASADTTPEYLVYVSSDTATLDIISESYDLLYNTIIPAELSTSELVDSSNWASPKLTTSFIWAVSTITFLGSLIGILVGKSGLLLLLVEAPVFYASCYLLFRSDPENGLSLLQKITRFDQWRKYNWWGEEFCYDFIARHYPSRSGEILIGQLFGTARHEFASKKIVDWIFSKNPEESISLLLPLVPFPEFEQLNDMIFPKTTSKVLLRSKTLINAIVEWDESQLSILDKKRSGIFSELVKRAETYPRNHQYLILQTFDNLTVFLSGNLDSILEVTPNIRLGFGDYQELPHIAGIVSLVSATELSLLVADYQAIGQSERAWLLMRYNATQDSIYKDLEPFAKMLADFANAFAKLNSDDRASLGTVSFRSLYLRGLLEKNKDAPITWIPLVSLISNHWDSLLISHLQSELPILT